MNAIKAKRISWSGIFVYVFLSFAVLGQAAEQPNNTWDGTVEQKIMGLMTVWSEAKYNFPFFDQRPELNWDEKVRDYLPRVIAAEDIDSYYDVLCEFAALLKDGHTAVNRPGGPFNPANDWPPLEIQVVDRQYVVVRLEETEEIRNNNIYPGLEIVEVEGVPVGDYFQSQIVLFESRGTQHADEAINIYRLLLGPKNTKVKLKVKDVNGFERSIVLTRNSATKSGETFFPRLFEWYMTKSPIEIQNLDDNIVYIRISNFGSEQVVTDFTRRFDQIEWTNVAGLILDIRFNPGGDDQFAWPIIGFFISDPIKSLIWRSPKYVPAYISWGIDPEWEQGFIVDEYIKPRVGKRFSGPLVILTGHSTYSTAEDFVIPFDFSDRAILVGETTAGSTGNPRRVPLAGGGNFRVVTLRTLYPDGADWVGTGVKPDVEVQLSQQDIYEEKTPILTKGIEVINNWDVFSKTLVD